MNSNGVRPRWERTDLLLPDRTISVRQAGTADGEPAVFVHGLGGSSTNWTDLMGELGDTLDEVALDLPGFGWSPPPRDGDYTPAGHARSVAALIEARFARPVHVFGNSLGGAVSVQLASSRPDLVRSLTLVSPALPEYRPRSTTVQLPVISVPGLGAAIIDKYLERPALLRVADSIGVCYADPDAFPAERWAEAEEDAKRWSGLPYASDAVRSTTRGLLLGFLSRSARPWEALERVAAPVLCIYGREDKLVNSRSAVRVSRHLPGTRVVVLPGVGHVAQMERPAEVARIWREWRAEAG